MNWTNYGENWEKIDSYFQCIHNGFVNIFTDTSDLVNFMKHSYVSGTFNNEKIEEEINFFIDNWFENLYEIDEKKVTFFNKEYFDISYINLIEKTRKRYINKTKKFYSSERV